MLRCLRFGVFLTHGDYALDNDASFLALVEHKLVPARARSEGARLKRAGLSSFWSLACQNSDHVGHAEWALLALGASPYSSYFCHCLFFFHLMLTVGPLGVACLLALGAFFIWWWSMGFKALPLIRRS